MLSKGDTEGILQSVNAAASSQFVFSLYSVLAYVYIRGFNVLSIQSLRCIVRYDARHTAAL